MPRKQDLHLTFELNGPLTEQELDTVIETAHQMNLQIAQIYAQSTDAIWTTMTKDQRNALLDIVKAYEDDYQTAAGKNDVVTQLDTLDRSSLFTLILRSRQALGLTQAQQDALLGKNAEWTPKYLAHTGGLRDAEKKLHDASFDKEWGSDNPTKLANAAADLNVAATTVAERSSAFEREYALAMHFADSVITPAQDLILFEVYAQETADSLANIAGYQEPMHYLSSGIVVSSLSEQDRLATLQRLQDAIAALSTPNPTQAQLDEAAKKTRLALDNLER